jgi:aminobutyraldehyde dehydrogenase
MIALTGSVNSGKAGARNASATLRRVYLELGGKAPVIVFDDADLATAANALRTAGYWNSGQECGAGCRVLVHDSVAAEFTDHLVAEVGSLIVGEPGAGDDVEIGPLISKAHFDRVCGFLDRARAEGVRAVLGGSAVSGPGYFVAPTVLTDVPAGAECGREEIFGPVVTIETFSDETEAIERANASCGLAASVWTENARRGTTSRLGSTSAPYGSTHLVLASEVPGRVQGFRIWTRPVHLPRRLLPYEARHAQPHP